MRRFVPMLSALTLMVTLVAVGSGCGNGNTNGFTALPDDTTGSGQTLSFGSLTTRVAGTAQPPVIAAGSGAVVTGLAGGLINSVSLQDPSGTAEEARIAFYSNRDGNYEIYSANPDGTGQKRLTNDLAEDSSPIWSPDGTRIAFLSRRNNQVGIWLMNAADGSGLVQVTPNGEDERDPYWAPDGNLYVARKITADNYDIYKIDLTNNNARAAIGPSSAPEFSPMLSPDRSKIAFSTTRGGNGWAIWVMNADGSSPLRLTYGGNEQEPVWSPDGSKILYNGVDSNHNVQVYSISAGGTGQTQLTTQSENFQPHWSPDGKSIYFTSIRSGRHSIYSMDPDGGNQKPVIADNSINTDAVWSPFIKTRTLIGTNGTMGTATAGFLFGQQGKIARSLVTFDTTDPTLRKNVRIISDSGISPGIPNILYTIAAEGLGSLKFSQAADWSPITVIGAGGVAATASGAVVSFDAADGTIASVLPYTSTRASDSSAPKITTENGVRILRGKFLGVWDSKGKNIAPQGANAVHFDAQSGKLLSVQ